MKHSSPATALEWAEEILTIREGGRSNAAMMEMLGNGGISLDYSLLDAIEIRGASVRACKGGHPCPYQRPRCLFHWYLPDPKIEYPVMSEAQENRIRECCLEFHEMLYNKQLVEEPPFRRRRR